MQLRGEMFHRAGFLSFVVAFTAIFLLATGVWISKNFFGKESPVFQPVVQEGSVLSTRIRSLASEAPELIFVSGLSIRPATPPVTVNAKILGTIIGETGFDPSRTETTHYIVESGDTLSSLAEKFGISENTIRWANDGIGNSLLVPGKELVILPVSGTLHMVRPNDTLSEVAMWYKADAEEIVGFNLLSSSQDIYAGDLLVIPNGTMPKTVPIGRLTPVANSYFIYPIPAPHRITQGLHYYNAIDFSNGRCGEPIYAAAGGVVQKTEFTRVGGNGIRILHPNGVVTYYGHLSNFAVSPGDRVLQGEIIGYTGHTGYTIPAGPSGCHLHFDVRGAKNPFAK